MVSETAGTLTQIKAAAPNCNRTHGLHHYVTAVKNNASFKNVLDKAVKIASFNKSQCFSTCPFIILCKEMVSMHITYTEI